MSDEKKFTAPNPTPTERSAYEQLLALSEELGIPLLPEDHPYYTGSRTRITLGRPSEQRQTAQEAVPAAPAEDVEPDPPPFDENAWRSLPGASLLDDYPTKIRVPKNRRVICSWFIENPVGSTFCELALIARKGGFVSIYFRVEHDEFPESLTFADLPRETADDPDALVEVLRALFARNGAEEYGVYLLKCPPHAVWIGEVLSEEQVRDLFLASREIGGNYDEPLRWWESVRQDRPASGNGLL
jgi:hypothetical protein